MSNTEKLQEIGGRLDKILTDHAEKAARSKLEQKAKRAGENRAALAKRYRTETAAEIGPAIREAEAVESLYTQALNRSRDKPLITKKEYTALCGELKGIEADINAEAKRKVVDLVCQIREIVGETSRELTETDRLLKRLQADIYRDHDIKSKGFTRETSPACFVQGVTDWALIHWTSQSILNNSLYNMIADTAGKEQEH